MARAFVNGRQGTCVGGREPLQHLSKGFDDVIRKTRWAKVAATIAAFGTMAATAALADSAQAAPTQTGALTAASWGSGKDVAGLHDASG